MIHAMPIFAASPGTYKDIKQEGIGPDNFAEQSRDTGLSVVECAPCLMRVFGGLREETCDAHPARTGFCKTYMGSSQHSETKMPEIDTAGAVGCETRVPGSVGVSNS